MAGHPSDSKYKDMKKTKLLPKLPITTHDTTNTNYMFGTNIVCVRGKALRNKQSRVFM